MCNSHNSHVKRNIITPALKGNSVRPQKMKGGWGGGGGGGGMTLCRLLLSVERASTTLEFNAFPQRCAAQPALRGNNSVQPLGDYGRVKEEKVRDIYTV